MEQIDPGSLLYNRFEIERRVRSGGMGTVYRARDKLTGEPVALKLLRMAGNALESQRFVREAQLLSELRHPGIVAHIAHGLTSEGQPFLAMEWLEGEDLSQRLSRGPLPLRDCVTLMIRVAEALRETHQRGILHREPADSFFVRIAVG